MDILFFGSARGLDDTLPFFERFIKENGATAYSHILVDGNSNASKIRQTLTTSLSGMHTTEDQKSVDIKHNFDVMAAGIQARGLKNWKQLQLKDHYSRPSRYSIHTIMNWIRSKYSMLKVGLLYQKYGRGDYALVTRLDLMIDRLNLPRAPVKNVIYVPNFHHNAGVNDRMAFGSRNVILYYTRLFKKMDHVSMNLFVRSSEGFLCWYLTRKHVTIGLFQACFTRFRANSTAIMDMQISRQAPYECISMGAKLVGDYDLTRCPGDLQDIPVASDISYSGDTQYYANMSSFRCTTVAFTNMLYLRGSQFVPPGVVRDKTTCHIAAASSYVIQRVPVYSWGMWRPLTVRVIGNGSTRLLSKYMKLSFFRLYPSVNRFVFIDAKLRMMFPVAEITKLLKANMDILFYRHPCSYETTLDVKICKYSRVKYKNWFEREVDLVTTKNRTDTPYLYERTKRLVSFQPMLNYNYADTALMIIQRSEQSINFVASWRTMLVKYGIDRDQFALPFLNNHKGIQYYDSITPECTRMCSWWDKRSLRVAKMKSER